ncbi:MAG: cellulase family glycosylhydrolase [Bacteroidota bacterium]|nr:cellulase family glycosylhydrolase [Bacteroidota bacterium]
MKKLLFLVISTCTLLSTNLNAQTQRPVWSKEKANHWYATKGWIRGSNFIPSSAINQLEMWQKETFDTATINRELGFAENIGFNAMRVFLHHVAWQVDAEGFKKRMNTYLNIAHKHHVNTIFVIFDDCWNDNYKAGKQPAPKTGIHNSGWLRDPGTLYHTEPALGDTLEEYVKDILTTFKNDKRILLWDLYNEPGNSAYGNQSLDLLKKVFSWARQINPDQPVSAGLWNKDLKELNRFQLANDDVITYHNYSDEAEHKKVIDSLKAYGRPLICTEYMARPRRSKFQNIMPLLKQNNVGAINWGFVSGKTNTIYAWDTPMPGGAEPKVWFHDIFRKDGTPYSMEEVKFIKSLTGKNAPKKRLHDRVLQEN